MRYLTDEVKAMIGVEGPVSVSLPLDPDRLRRFVHAAMETNPVHWDEQAAEASRYGGLVTTPLWPIHAHVRTPGESDPFDLLLEEPDWDGAPVTSPGGLPPLPIPLERLLNGGTDAQFFALAKVGDVITSRSHYSDIVEREGRSGPMVIARIETTHRNQHDELLAVVTMTLIWR